MDEFHKIVKQLEYRRKLMRESRNRKDNLKSENMKNSKINYALLVDGRKNYTVTYLTSSQSSSGKREEGSYQLKGTDLTENQIKGLHENGVL